MKDLKTISGIYFIGIGGIGMSALARYFNTKGVHVSGYDKTRSSLTDQLESEGIRIHFSDTESLLDKSADVVVYTPAVPKDHKQLNYYLSHDYVVLKRSDVLQEITRDTFNICIAGTHGKTTTSAMVAHILKDAGIGCTAILGGISVNYETNYWSTNDRIFVIEADEYDRSFLKLSPDIASISSMDADHLDIYGTHENMEDAFIAFTSLIKPKGLLMYKFDLKRKNDFYNRRSFSYSLSNSAADVYAKNIVIADGGYSFEMMFQQTYIGQFQLNVGGMHNVENSITAIKIALEVGVGIDKVQNAIASFKGVKRRFEYIERNIDTGNIYIDDYAHHPAELNALLSSAKKLFPEKKCTVIFQPHLFSRTRDLASEFASALDKADRVVLLPIYPAREKPIEGITSDVIFQHITKNEKMMVNKEGILDWVRTDAVSKNNLYITAGAGDIDNLINSIKGIIGKNEHSA